MLTVDTLKAAMAEAMVSLTPSNPKRIYLDAPAGYSSAPYQSVSFSHLTRRRGYTAPLMIPKAKPKAKAPQHPLVFSLLGAIAQLAVEGRMRGYRQPTPPREVHGKKAGAYGRGLQNQWARQRRDAIEEKHRG